MKAKLKAAWKWFVDGARDLYPWLACVVGGLIISADLGWGGFMAASIVFVWAIDMAGTMAAARARVETATMLAAMLMSGRDTTITVDINDNN